MALSFYLTRTVCIIAQFPPFCSFTFKFLVIVIEDTTKRTSLTSIPMSGAWVFGPSDVDELLFLLQDSPVNTSFSEGDSLSEAMMARYRPSRIRAMFASRACRKAVMVGTALTHTKMKKYLEQLSTLKHPWVINIKQSEFKPQVFF